MADVTQLLQALEQGDRHAAGALLPLVYQELRRLAARQLSRESAGQTLDATGLVHEAYLRLVGPVTEQQFANRRHFFATAAQAMRRILVENARRKRRHKRGGGWQRADVDVAQLAGPVAGLDLLALDEALTRLQSIDALKAELIQLRFFAGCGNDEAASLLGISAATAKRHWRYARAWLRRELQDDKNS